MNDSLPEEVLALYVAAGLTAEEIKAYWHITRGEVYGR